MKPSPGWGDDRRCADTADSSGGGKVMQKTTLPIKYTDMEQTFTIGGTSYTEKKLVGILHGQLKGLKEYAHFAGASIELCHQNQAQELFFYVSRDDGEYMIVKIGQDAIIYWDWNGPVMD